MCIDRYANGDTPQIMNKHVTSLELSKKLKELEVKQESEFYWVQEFDKRKMKEAGVWVVKQGLEGINTKMREFYSAFLASELGEMLPYKTDLTISILKGNKEYHVSYWWGIPNPLRGESKITDYHRTHGNNQTDALAKMLIYLIENKLLIL